MAADPIWYVNPESATWGARASITAVVDPSSLGPLQEPRPVRQRGRIRGCLERLSVDRHAPQADTVIATRTSAFRLDRLRPRSRPSITRGDMTDLTDGIPVA